MRILVLHSRMSGYMAACHRAAMADAGCQIDLVSWSPDGEAPFDSSVLAHAARCHRREDLCDADLSGLAVDGGYDALVVSGWMDAGYLSAAGLARRSGRVVVAGCDTQWRGTLRQRLRSAVGRARLQSAFSALWVPGERQLALAQRLGFAGLRCWTGYYSADTEAFRPVDPQPASRTFLYVGRLIPRKGIETLLEAYRLYRASTSSPWSLRIIGNGPLERVCRSVPGVDLVGFVQPGDLPREFGSASALVLPSVFEAWGVVIHEATAAGLPVLCSRECGAGVHLVQDGLNGFKHTSGRADDLAMQMGWIARQDDQAWSACSVASRLLASQFSPARWARTLTCAVEALRA